MALIQHLYEPRSLWKRLKGSLDVTRVLTELGDSNEPSAIIDVLPFVLVAKPEIAAAAAKSVHKLVLATTIKELVCLDETLRQRSPYSGDQFYEWHKVSPDQLGILQGFGDASVSLLGMASFHQSGYVREAAIKRLDSITHAFSAPGLTCVNARRGSLSSTQAQPHGRGGVLSTILDNRRSAQVVSRH